jgi:hypothetical protein
MFLLTCPIIARSQYWLFALGANIRICPHIFIFALTYPYLPSNIRIFPQIQLAVSVQWSHILYVIRKDGAQTYA